MNFKNPLDPQNLQITKAIKTWATELYQLPDEVVITVAELKCCGEDCPHIETVITIWEAEPKRLRVQKPLVYVRKHDLVKLC